MFGRLRNANLILALTAIVALEAGPALGFPFGAISRAARVAEEAKVAATAERAVVKGSELADSARVSVAAGDWMINVGRMADRYDGQLIPLNVTEDGVYAELRGRRVQLSTQNQFLALVANEGQGSAIVIREDDLFHHKASIEAVSGHHKLLMYVEDADTLLPVRLEHVGGEIRVLVETRSGLWVEANDSTTLLEVRNILDRKTVATSVDLFSFFDPSRADLRLGLDRAAGTSHHFRGGADSDQLLKDVGRGENRIIIVMSHVEDGQAVVRDSGGRITGSILLADLKAAAERSDNTLVFLGCETSRSPVGGFVSTVRTDPIVATIQGAWHAGDFSLGDFLGRIGADNGGFVINRDLSDSMRRTLTIRPFRTNRGGVGSAATAASAGSVITAGSVAMPGLERQDELDSRIVPNVPSMLQYASLINWIFVLFGPILAWKSWSAFWQVTLGSVTLPLVAKVFGAIVFLIVGSWIVFSTRAIYLIMKFQFWLGFYAVALIVFMFLDTRESVVFASAYLLSIVAFQLYARGFLVWSPPTQMLDSNLRESALFLVLCIVLRLVIVGPFVIWMAVADWPTLSWQATGATWILAVAAACTLVVRTGEAPSLIVSRLWSDPFWIFRHLVPRRNAGVWQ